MRIYTHAPEYPAVYRMDNISDLRYMRKKDDRRQANCYKTFEDVKKYASNFEESRKYRREPVQCVAEYFF